MCYVVERFLHLIHCENNAPRKIKISRIENFLNWPRNEFKLNKTDKKQSRTLPPVEDFFVLQHIVLKDTTYPDIIETNENSKMKDLLYLHLANLFKKLNKTMYLIRYRKHHFWSPKYIATYSGALWNKF